MVILAYVKDIFEVFFKWWWAVITAIATFLPLFTLPNSLSISRGLLVLAVFVICLLVFVTISVAAQGYAWFVGSHNAPRVGSCLPAIAAGEEASQPEVITVSSVHDLQIGQVLTVFRETNRGIGCFGIIKVDRRISSHSDEYQCSPLWIAPIHKRDLSRDQVQVSQLSTSLFINHNDLVHYVAGAQEQ